MDNQEHDHVTVLEWIGLAISVLLLIACVGMLVSIGLEEAGKRDTIVKEEKLS